MIKIETNQQENISNVIDDLINKINDIELNRDNKLYKYDIWNQWTNESKHIAFKSNTKYIGNGEKKLANELNINDKLGGQNNIFDLKHLKLGNISVKDVTYTDCTLGTEGCQKLRKIFRKIVYPLLCWCEKYKENCIYADDIFKRLNKKYGSSRINIYDGIERFELSNSNFTMLNEILNDIMNIKNIDQVSIKSEYLIDIKNNLMKNSLIDKCNDCVRKEATEMTLIIVHEFKGWMIVKNLENITCPRITRGSPRININYN